MVENIYPLDILVIVDYPEMMSETVVRSHEVVLGLAVGVLLHDGVDLGVVRISEEYGLDVGVLDADVDHAVLLLVLAGELVLLDLAGEVVVHIGAEHDSVLGTAVHRLGVNIVALLLVLYQPAFLLPLLEVLDSLVVCRLRVLVDDGVEVYLGLGDVKEGLLSGLSLGLLGVEHVVRTGCHFLHDGLGRTDRCERFYFYHIVCLLSAICLPGTCGCL